MYTVWLSFVENYYKGLQQIGPNFVGLNNYLSVYKINNGMIEESPLANIPIYPDEEIIMTEWCGSSYVDQWERIFLNGEIIE